MQVGALAERVLAAPPRLRGARLVCLDGRAGAGKTRLAGQLAAALAAGDQVTTIAMDDLYAGWSGLPHVADEVRTQLLTPWIAGDPGRLSVWSWEHSRRLDPVPIELTPLVLLEGVGCWSRELEQSVSLLIWVECDEPTRRRRALQRDGDLFAPHWDAWAADEMVVHAREHTRERADLVVDTGAQLAAPVP